jgi:hypothetical protein
MRIRLVPRAAVAASGETVSDFEILQDESALQDIGPDTPAASVDDFLAVPRRE